VIRLTRLNGSSIALNSDLIKFVENAPDTVITLVNGEKMIVLETTVEVIHRVVEFRRSVLTGLPSSGANLMAPAVSVNSKHAGPDRECSSGGSHRG
jgi:flagellar protein FlbD